MIERDMSEEELRTTERQYSVINFFSTDGIYRVRYLTKVPCAGDKVAPTLEDSYTYIIQEDTPS